MKPQQRSEALIQTPVKVLAVSGVKWGLDAGASLSSVSSSSDFCLVTSHEDVCAH